MELETKNFYKFLAPRPVVLLTTVDKEKNINAAPISFIMPVSIEPPVLALSLTIKGSSIKNLQDIREFVVNVFSEKMFKQVWSCTRNPPTGVDELAKAGLTQMMSAKVIVPSIQEAEAWFECFMESQKEVGDHILVTGRVVHVTVRDDIVSKDGSIDLKNATTLMHIVGNKFAVAEREVIAK